MCKKNNESRMIFVETLDGKNFKRVPGGYVWEHWFGAHQYWEPYELPLLEGDTDTVEITMHGMGRVEVQPGPVCSYTDTPPFSLGENATGIRFDTDTGEFVEIQEEPDYGNGPGRAVARIMHRYRPVIW